MGKRVWTSLLLCFIMLFSAVSTGFAAKDQGESTHWAASVLNKWKENGWINGYPDGSLQPDAPVKRAELASLINRAFQLKTGSQGVRFPDMTDKHWAYHDFAVASKAGYIQGDAGGNVYPEKYTSRQEAAVMLAAVLKLSLPDKVDLSAWSDAADIADWSKRQVAAVAARQIMKGDTNGKFRPKALVTRAEAVVALDAALGFAPSAAKVFDKPGDYGSADKAETIAGNVVVSSKGVKLSNLTILGDLLLTEEIGEGDVYLNKVTVKGTTTVKGGGVNSIHLTDTVIVRIIVDKASGQVRIVASGSTSVQSAVVQSSVKLEESGASGSGFTNVELAKSLPKDASVTFMGDFENVSVFSSTVKITIPQGSVGSVTVGEGAGNNTIDISKDAKVLKLILDAVTQVVGEGKVDKATVNGGAKGSEFANPPASVDGTAKDDIVVAPPAQTGGVIIGGGGPGGGTGGENPCVSCDNAYLSEITLGSFELVKRNAQEASVGKGFDKNTFMYTVETPRDMTETTVPVTISAEASGATIHYVADDGKTLQKMASGSTQGTANFTISVKPMQDVRMQILIWSADQKHLKNYSIMIYHKRTVQEAFQINGMLYYSDTGNYQTQYNLRYGKLIYEPGDIVEIFRDVSDGSPAWTCTINPPFESCSMFNFNPDLNNDKELFIKVKREGSTIEQGDYIYQSTELPRIADTSGISVKVLTKPELIDEYNKFPDMYGNIPFSSGFRILFDRSAMKGELSAAKYYTSSVADTNGSFPVPYSAVMEDVKTGLSPYIARESLIPDSYNGAGYFSGGSAQVYDKYLNLYFYDENKLPLGFAPILVKFDEAHVRDGVTAVKNTSPVLDSTDKVAPNLYVSSTNVPAGGLIVLLGSENGVAYLLPSGIYSTRTDLQNAVQHGLGKAVSFDSMTGSQLNTAGITAGAWSLYAVDVNGNISSPIDITIFEQSSLPFWLTNYPMFPTYNTAVDIQFDKSIANNKPSDAELKAAITFSSDGGATFKSLDAADTVSILGNKLRVTFGQAYTGQSNQIKIAKGTLKSFGPSGIALDVDVVTPAFKEGTAMTVEGAIDSGLVIVNNVGDSIKLTLDRPDTVYLVPRGTPMPLSDLEEAVNNKKGKKLTVNASEAGLEQTISTAELLPGNYMLFALGGNIMTVELAMTSWPDNINFAFRNWTDAADEVDVGGVSPGDTILVYPNFTPGSSPLVPPVTVQEGETSATITGLNLSENGGTLYLTVKSPGKAESSVRGYNYGAAVTKP